MKTRSRAKGTPHAVWFLLAAPGIAAWWVLLVALVVPARTSNWLFPIAFEAVNYTSPLLILAGLVAFWSIMRRR